LEAALTVSAMTANFVNWKTNSNFEAHHTEGQRFCTSTRNIMWGNASSI